MMQLTGMGFWEDHLSPECILIIVCHDAYFILNPDSFFLKKKKSLQPEAKDNFLF